LQILSAGFSGNLISTDPETVYFDPTTDNLFELFRAPGSEYWIAEENSVIIGGCGVYPTPGLPEGCAELVNFIFQQHRGKRNRTNLMEKILRVS